MLTATTPVPGSAGYVAIERVTGVLHGRRAALCCSTAAAWGGSQHLRIDVVPGSGTGELLGLAGEFALRIETGQHHHPPLPAARPVKAAPLCCAPSLGWLAQREHSRLELRRKLLRVLHKEQARQGDEDAEPADAATEVDALLDELATAGHLSDARFIESRVYTRASRLGTQRIRQELAQHGLALDAEQAGSCVRPSWTGPGGCGTSALVDKARPTRRTGRANPVSWSPRLWR